MKIGFAITCYNKFEEAQILFEIIRKEFKQNYPISFCSNHPEGLEFARENDVDVFVSGRDLSLEQPTSKVKYADPLWKKNLRNHTILRIRALDSVQKSCQGALDLDVDYIIHMHSDAWVLNEKKLQLLIKQLHSKNKMLAVRGDGLERVDYVRTPSNACGHLDDHFFVFNRKFCMDNLVFDFKPESLFPHKYSVHGMLMMVFVNKIGLHNIWYYRKLNELVCYDNQRFKVKNVKPCIYDPTYGFVHIHRASFPDDYGKRIQAMYLTLDQLGQNSKLIKDFIQQYYDPYAVSYLLDIEKELNRKMKLRLYPRYKIDKREITIKENLLHNFNYKTLFENICYPFKDWFIKKFFPYTSNLAKFYDEVLEIDNDWSSDIYDSS